MPGYDRRTESGHSTSSSSSSSSSSSYRPTDVGPEAPHEYDHQHDESRDTELWGDAAFKAADHFDWYDDPTRI